MCGYVRRDYSAADLPGFMRAMGMPQLFQTTPQPDYLMHFYPAFGGATGKIIPDLIIRSESEVKTVNATWWFDCYEEDGQLIVGARTTFNARNLKSPFWKGAIRHHRAIVLATAIGEGKNIDGKNVHYLVEGIQPLLLGAVYREFPSGHYSTAIITRDAHPRFDKYHDKAFPFFLPPDPEILKHWLSPVPETDSVICDLLEHPVIYNDLRITKVKTLKGGVALGESEFLHADKN